MSGLLLASMLAWGQPIVMNQPSDPVEQARTMMRAGRYRMAAQTFRQLIADDPEHVVAKGGLAQALVGLGRCYHARPYLDEVWGTAGWTAEVATAEGLCAFRAGDYAEAIALFEDATEMQPDFARAWYPMARAAAAVDDGPLAERALEALAMRIDSPFIEGMARSWMALSSDYGDVDAELAILERRLSRGPYRVNAWGEYGELRARLALRDNRPDAAVDALHSYAYGEWDNAELLALAAEGYRRLGDGASAASIWDSNLMTRHRTPEVRLLRCFWLIDEGRDDEVQEILRLTEGEHTALSAAVRWYRADGPVEHWQSLFDQLGGPAAYGNLGTFRPQSL